MKTWLRRLRGAAVVGLIWGLAWGMWYQRWKRKKPIRIARALVAKELAKSVYVVLHDQVDFNQQCKGTPLTRQKQARWPRRASPSA